MTDDVVYKSLRIAVHGMDHKFTNPFVKQNKNLETILEYLVGGKSLVK